MSSSAVPLAIPATLNPRLLALYGCEMPKRRIKEWMKSQHVVRIWKLVRRDEARRFNAMQGNGE